MPASEKVKLRDREIAALRTLYWSVIASDNQDVVEHGLSLMQQKFNLGEELIQARQEQSSFSSGLFQLIAEDLTKK